MPAATINRRELLRASGAGRLVFRPEAGPRGDVLVSIFLRGGMDGLHTVPPHGEPAYHRQRPTLAVGDAGRAGGAVDLDGRFGLHPDLAPLAELFHAKRLA